MINSFCFTELLESFLTTLIILLDKNFVPNILDKCFFLNILVKKFSKQKGKTWDFSLRLFRKILINGFEFKSESLREKV